MAFTSTMDFLLMGKHGFYVWSAYGISLLVLMWLVWQTLSARRKTYTRLQKRFYRDESSNKTVHPTGRQAGGVDASR
ncbi:heme exporter protein CcmD [Marinomonas sp. A79]|uniref:Heme exporter protein D n=1 Tax=Marinomonas vulgaris TaxID=2823372 RepID=A0ABS5HB87_9GAMM|nr:heme exporter protein CcmD [Marinomonas vulgaris]MBR7888663.1 heme exporter protein CcmD [Marinomonas vulgaris]